MKDHKRVLIVGAGFAGLSAAKALHRAPVAIRILDRTNHHLFQPLLYQVATAGLSPGEIAAPIREILARQKNVTVVLAEVDGFDLEKRVVQAGKRSFAYDYLIVATGARHSYFGHPEWENQAPGLKDLRDALDLRRRILSAFEVAEIASDESEREAAMRFVVVGAGPTGVEMAGAIAELARFTLAREYRNIRPSEAKVLLVEGGSRVLPAFAPDLSVKAEKQLKDLGVEVLCGSVVEQIDSDSVTVSGRKIPARTVVWAAGNAASPLGALLGAPTDRAGRVMVAPDLSLPGHPEVFVLGDMAHVPGPDGKPLPGVSPVAIQQGRLAARNIRNQIAGRATIPFKYFDKGSMATIGRHAAVAQIGALRFAGFLAWLAWLLVHLIFLVGFRNRAAVLLRWAYAYFTFKKGARLISG